MNYAATLNRCKEWRGNFYVCSENSDLKPSACNIQAVSGGRSRSKLSAHNELERPKEIPPSALALGG
jgi:hypothetical protein